MRPQRKAVLVSRDLGEAVSADYGGDGDHGVIAEMEEEAGEDGAGVRAGEGEDYPHEDQQADDAPGPTELGAVHQAEEDAGKQNAGNDPEGFCEERIEIPAKDGFLHERGYEDSHS